MGALPPVEFSEPPVPGVPPVALLDEPPVAFEPPVCIAPPVVEEVLTAVFPPVALMPLDVPPVDDAPPVPSGALGRQVPRKHWPPGLHVLSALQGQPTVPAMQVVVVATDEFPPVVVDVPPPVELVVMLVAPPVVSRTDEPPPVDSTAEPLSGLSLKSIVDASLLPQAVVMNEIAST